MVMGTGIRDLRGMTSEFKYDQLFSTSSFTPGVPPMLDNNSFIDLQNIPFNPIISGPTSSAPTADATTSSAEADSAEDSEIFSDIVLSYINQMLMDEDMDDKFEQFQEHPALLAAEKPFYDILAENHSPPPDHPPLYSNYSSESPDDGVNNHYGSSSCSNSVVVDGSWPCDSVEYQQLQTHPASVDYSSQSSFSSTNSVGNIVEGFDESLLNSLALSDLLTQSQPAWEQFRRGVEEARKFLPGEDKLVIHLEADGVSIPQQPRRENELREVKAEKEEREYLSQGSRGRKNRHSDDLELVEGRSNKQSAVFPEQTVRTAMFDMVLLHNEQCTKGPCELRAAMEKEKEASKSSQSNQSRGSGGGKGRGKRQPKREVVDLRTILVHCAQAVATDDRRNAGELLKQIRQHSSPHGDAAQRLAHYFADGLQARLAGTGSQIYHSLAAKRTSATDILKAYHLFMSACPFKKISHFFSNQTILDAVGKARRVHIVDYGIYYGFQWPCFLQCLSSRPGGPPSVRITGIDLPQPGFRPRERIEETGRRLADYCRSFQIPFEYHAIAAKWETVRVEDLNIDKDEVVVVNCLYRLRNVVDETVVVDSPRNKVLNTIRKMNPDVFIHGIVNGCYGAPFFVTRFREALFHFSALFDMLETTVPREDDQRLLIEREICGREALNVISCEGLERVERPETYKQWHVRNLRAGFTLLPLKPEIMKKARDKMKACYHKDFVVDEDSGWLLQGWKGRIIYALSTWKPNNAS
ncbi:scarecrow-like protein 9 [Elaeis guineensis]|uniref:Scarecrow-like protein 9 n=1 Tax=Elaeis guineensis var. tenera TaxID=51953 RepID=A0A6I9RSH5_ELAGV|nr:scarecrow-like protein 9 [Elaeis guineensis]